MGEINLGKYQLRTDLIIESEEVISSSYQESGISVSKTIKDGNYITISFEDITNYENRERVGKILERELKSIIKLNHINEDDECLIIGLGNLKSTPDSLGVKVIDDIVVTKHLFKFGNVKEGIRAISTFTPGVMATTGLESAKMIKAIINEFHPKFVIAIDALASRGLERINKIIQITDTGIHPGSGVGNNRLEISTKTLDIPVIAIGVPTVVSSSTIVYDTLEYLYKHISYIKENESLNKLTFRNRNYLNKIKDRELSSEEKNQLLGLFGGLENNEKKSLIQEVLGNIQLDLIVTPSEIDFQIDKMSNLIANSINNALHRQISHF